MGPDGHCASLFPETAALQEKSRLVVANWVEKFKTFRITFTLPLLNAAREVMFLVSGTDKAPVLREVLEGKAPGEKFPSKLVKPTDGKLIWFVDRAAASELSRCLSNLRIAFCYARQPLISFRPFPRACSKSRTRWRECSNSWISAHTSARQLLS